MRIALLLLLTASSLRADSLSVLRDSLRLTGDDPVSAAIDFSFADTNGDEKKPTTVEGRAIATVCLGAAGLSVVWSPEQLVAAVREQREGTGKAHHPEPTRQAMSRLGATQIYDYLNASDGLLQRLETATLQSEKEESWQGQPARLLTLKLAPPLSEEDRKMIKQIEATAKIWIALDGTPLAAESALRLKGRAMVVISFEHSETEYYSFARAGDRLVITSHQRETADHGGGQHHKSKTTATLQLAAQAGEGGPR